MLCGSFITVTFAAKWQRVEQRYCITFCQKLRHGAETIWNIQQAFGYDAMGSTQINQWYNRFKDGRTSGEKSKWCHKYKSERHVLPEKLSARSS